MRKSILLGSLPTLAASFFLVAAALVSAGCDDLSSGWDPPDPSPPVLVHIMIQDQDPRHGRGLAVDLLDTPSTAIACDDSTPCPGDSHCSSASGAGSCVDPHDPRTTAPPLGLRTPGGLGGTQIRLVFSKPLDASLETFTDGGAPVIPAGLVGLFLAGDPVDVVADYDPTGSPNVDDAIDPAAFPDGPALVLVPRAPLHVSTTYTITFDGTRIVDALGQAAVIGDGTVDGGSYTALPESARYDFTTEPFVVLDDSSCPSRNCYPSAPLVADSETIATDSYLALALNADVDEVTLSSVHLLCDGHSVASEIFFDRGSDDSACASALDPRLIDVVPISTSGVRARLGGHSCTLVYDGLSDADTGRSTLVTQPANLIVVAADAHDAADPDGDHPSTGIVLPEECVAAGAGSRDGGT